MEMISETENVIKKLLKITLEKNNSFLLKSIERKIQEEISLVVENDPFIKNSLNRIITQNLETMVQEKIKIMLQRLTKSGHIKNLINHTILQEMNRIKFDEKIKLNFDEDFLRKNISLNEDIFPKILRERYAYLIENNCCVCFEQTKRKTQCNHLLCQDCENSLISKSCPYCRGYLS
jgi:hypothetical protein